MKNERFIWELFRGKNRQDLMTHWMGRWRERERGGMSWIALRFIPWMSGVIRTKIDPSKCWDPVKWFINIRYQIKLDGVGRSKPPVKSYYLKVKIRTVCIPWAHTSWEIAQGIPRCTRSQLGLTIISRRSINWIHLYVDISKLTRSTCVVTLKTTIAAIYWVLAACLKMYIYYVCRRVLF